MSDDDFSDEEIVSITSSKTIYKRSRSQTTRSSSLDERRLSQDSYLQDESYLPVTKWAIDYNNKNYVRSQCNKNIGLHRRERGRPEDWHIQYDNSYYTRSKVNSPKGLHRQISEIPRKYTPEKDELADATGWEFDCGPGFDQVEQDVPYIPEGKIITRGSYRWYGVRRNDSDCDIKQKEYREPVLSRSEEEELKYGQEFLQSDIPYLTEQKEKRYTRGGYRHYEVLRNAYDITPEELASAAYDAEWRRKHHSNGFRYLDIEMCKYDRDDISGHHCRTKKGKPFRRTILQKVYELRAKDDSRESIPKRPATRLSLVPGEGQKTVYEGVSDRHEHRGSMPSSVRSVYEKKSKSRSEYGEFEKGRGYKEMTPDKEERLHKMARDKRVPHRRSLYHEDDRRQRRKGSRRFHEYGTEVPPESTVHRREVDKSKYHEGRYQEKERRSPGKRAEFYYEDRDYPPGDIVVQKKCSHVEEYRVTRRGSRDRSKDRDRNIYHEQHRKSGRRSDEYDDRREGGGRSARYDDRREGGRKSVGYEERREGGRRSTEYEDRREGGRKSVGYEERREGGRRSAEYEEPREGGRKSAEYKERREGGRRSAEYEERREGGRRSAEYEERREGHREHRKKGSSSSSTVKDDENYFEVELRSGKDKAAKKLPPHVESRMKQIREKMERKMGEIKERHPDEGCFIDESEYDIDLMKHKGHPHDRGETHNSEYEKYVTKNGSEIWMKKEESFAELHHKDH